MTLFRNPRMITRCINTIAHKQPLPPWREKINHCMMIHRHGHWYERQATYWFYGLSVANLATGFYQYSKDEILSHDAFGILSIVVVPATTFVKSLMLAAVWPLLYIDFFFYPSTWHRHGVLLSSQRSWIVRDYEFMNPYLQIKKIIKK